MNYGYTVDGTGWPERDWRIKTLEAVLFLIPKANPDYAVLFPKIKKWCLEIDAEGAVAREIALDGEGVPIFHIPDGTDNRGFWIDEDRLFSAQDLEPMTREEFERLWTLSKKEPNQAPEPTAPSGRGSS